MINGNLEFTKTDFMQYRDLEISLEWHIIQLQELKENYKMRKVDECVEEKIYLAVSMAVIDGMPYRTISDKISYSTPQVSRYISQFFKNLECYKAFLKAKEEAAQLCFCMKKETNETQSERHET